MSIRSYFAPNIPNLRMPKTPDGSCSNGIKWTGEVLQGNLSTNEAFALDRIAAYTRSSCSPDLSAAEKYRILNVRNCL